MRRHTLRNALLAALVASAALVSSPALAQGEFLRYERAARVAGEGNAVALIRASGGFYAVDKDAHDFRAVHRPVTDPFYFRGAGGVLADVALRFDHNGCHTHAEASAMAATSYEFVGDYRAMSFEIGSAHGHTGSIRRRSTSIGLGGSVVTYTDDFHKPPIITQVPFTVAGGDNGVLTVSLRLDRRDTGPTDGKTSMRWEVFVERPSASVIPEPPIASGAGRVGPNDSFEAPPTRFRVPRGHYLLRMTYASEVGMEVISECCKDPAKDSSDVKDRVVLDFELWGGNVPQDEP